MPKNELECLFKMQIFNPEILSQWFEMEPRHLFVYLFILASTLMIAVQHRERLTGAAVVRQSSMKEATGVIKYFCARECQKSSQESVRRT